MQKIGAALPKEMAKQISTLLKRASKTIVVYECMKKLAPVMKKPVELRRAVARMQTASATGLFYKHDIAVADVPLALQIVMQNAMKPK